MTLAAQTVSKAAKRNYERNAETVLQASTQHAILQNIARHDHSHTRKPDGAARTFAMRDEFLDARSWDERMELLISEMWINPDNVDPVVSGIFVKPASRLRYASTFYAKAECTHPGHQGRCTFVSRTCVAQDHQLSLVAARREAFFRAETSSEVVAAMLLRGLHCFTFTALCDDDETAVAIQDRLHKLTRRHDLKGACSFIMHDHAIIGILCVENLADLSALTENDTVCDNVVYAPLKNPDHLARFFRRYPDTMERIKPLRVAQTYLERKQRAAANKHASVDETSEFDEVTGEPLPAKPKRSYSPAVRLWKSCGVFHNHSKSVATGAEVAYAINTDPAFTDVLGQHSLHAIVAESLNTREDFSRLAVHERSVENAALAYAAAGGLRGDVRAVCMGRVVAGAAHKLAARLRRRARKAPCAAPDTVCYIDPVKPWQNQTCKLHGEPIVMLEVMSIGRHGANVNQLTMWERAVASDLPAFETVSIPADYECIPHIGHVDCSCE